MEKNEGLCNLKDEDIHTFVVVQRAMRWYLQKVLLIALAD